MAETICLVVANSVKDTGRVSFRFKALSGLPYEDCIAYPTYGLLRLEEKKPDEVNPWRLVRGEPGAIGPDGFQKWTVSLFDSGGQCIATSVDEDKVHEQGLQLLLKQDLPDCALLVEKQNMETLQLVCQLSGVNIKVHLYDGELPTS